MSSENRSNLNTIDNNIQQDPVQMLETSVIHPDIILEIPASWKTNRK